MSVFIENKAREKAYEEMCAKCEKEHSCHNACESCEEYEDRVDEIYDELVKGEELL